MAIPWICAIYRVESGRINVTESGIGRVVEKNTITEVGGKFPCFIAEFFRS